MLKFSMILQFVSNIHSSLCLTFTAEQRRMILVVSYASAPELKLLSVSISGTFR